MIVRELIDKLKECPQESLVFTVYDTGYSYPEVTGVIPILTKVYYSSPDPVIVVFLTDVRGDTDDVYLSTFPKFELNT